MTRRKSSEGRQAASLVVPLLEILDPIADEELAEGGVEAPGELSADLTRLLHSPSREQAALLRRERSLGTPKTAKEVLAALDEDPAPAPASVLLSAALVLRIAGLDHLRAQDLARIDPLALRAAARAGEALRGLGRPEAGRVLGLTLAAAGRAPKKDNLLWAELLGSQARLALDERRFEEAGALANQALQLADAAGHSLAGARQYVTIGIVTGQRGDGRSAAMYLTGAAAVFRLYRSPELGEALHWLGWCSLEAGMLGAAGEACLELEDPSLPPLPPWLALRHRWLRARLRAAAGELQVAARDLTAVAAELLALGRAAEYVVALADAVEALAGLGRREEAMALLGRMQQASERLGLGGPAAHAVEQARLALESASAAGPGLREALVDLRRAAAAG